MHEAITVSVKIGKIIIEISKIMIGFTNMKI